MPKGQALEIEKSVGTSWKAEQDKHGPPVGGSLALHQAFQALCGHT